MSALRLAVVGAFPFPLAQGSQVFARDQVRALTKLGADVTLFCYGSGEGKAAADLKTVRVARVLSPAALQAGPSFGKPLADAALAAALLKAHRRQAFDAVLAHNGEAAFAALLARSGGGAPVVYVAHTLLEHELPTFAPALMSGATRTLGRILDRTIVSQVDATVALCRDAVDALAPHAHGPVELIAPGLDPGPAPEPGDIANVCKRHGLEPGGFAFYSGNVDRYQGLGLMLDAARRVPDRSWVVATHGDREIGIGEVRCIRTTPEEARILGFGCGVSVLPRRRPGGFPIKLLNAMEAARPVVAFKGIADGLEHGYSAILLSPEDGADVLASEVCGLLDDPVRGDRIGAAARAHLDSHHDWRELATRTLLFCAEASKR